MKKFINRAISLAVVSCLAFVGIVFNSCKTDEQKSNYLYIVELAKVDQDPALCMQFELNGLPIIMSEMKKASDRSDANSIIINDTRANADKRAKDAFAEGVAKLRKETNNSYAGLIVCLNLSDPDTNQPIEIDKVTL